MENTIVCQVPLMENTIVCQVPLMENTNVCPVLSVGHARHYFFLGGRVGKTRSKPHGKNTATAWRV